MCLSLCCSGGLMAKMHVLFSILVLELQIKWQGTKEYAIIHGLHRHTAALTGGI